MRRFTVHWLPTLLLVFMLPTLVLLGLWQLHRAQEKRDLLALQAQHQIMVPGTLDELLQVADPAWRRVHVQGVVDAEHSLLLDNSSRQGQVGVELLQPLQDQLSGMWVLLNRGWLPWPDRRVAPLFSTPDTLLDIQAWVYVPPGPGFRLQADAVPERWPHLITVVEPTRLWRELGRVGYAHQLRLLPGPAAYRVDWPVVNMAPDTHSGYAVQWFSLAAALLGLYLYLGFNVTKGRSA
ncbi:SURF1 family protein [Pseudomonas sp. 3A(2025)]